ncbi:hypothetical protein E5Q_05301 [Mixia osmundae IAM 14324]|uniref:PhoD-like phosphatase metallophosphatase domain-containing protein n=1 Tax=Mixia osmundae (strain CBS 9802 / IAM 14324 / JCM 22182 / KY 12970) TaxID=764103 RepID=G7E704_MIXOS|nr:hypothetical protein E5Q_05301 [Mixia osmundae IAM 14324]
MAFTFAVIGSTIASTLLRLGGFFFLRWFPGHIFATALPTLYVAYLLTYLDLNTLIVAVEQDSQIFMEDHAERAADRLLQGKEAVVKSEDIAANAPAPASDKPGAPSYSSVAANGKTAKGKPGKAKNGSSKLDPKPENPLTSSRPSAASLLRMQKQASTLATPGPISFILGRCTRSRVFNRFSLAINTAILLMVIDFVYTPVFFIDHNDLAFARAGAVGDTWVKLSTRVPPLAAHAPITASAAHFASGLSSTAKKYASKLSMSGDSGLEPLADHLLDHSFLHKLNATISEPFAAVPILPRAKSLPSLDRLAELAEDGKHGIARILYRPTRPSGRWQEGPVVQSTADADYMSTVRLSNLSPATEYEYKLVSAVDGDILPSFGEKVQMFKTFPSPRLAAGASHFTFAASSCIIPGWPYVPFGDHLSVKGARYLSSAIESENVDFALLMGDFIYADTPYRGRSKGTKRDYFMRKYRQTYASEDMRKVYERVPIINVYDDHEIANDYAGESKDTPHFQDANHAYVAYNGEPNYDTVSDASSLLNSDAEKSNYYWFRHGDAAFFVLDARRYRSANEAEDDEQKTMLGEKQKRVFKEWLTAVNSTVTFKFVVTSTPFMTLWGGINGADDTWRGFQTERTELMDLLEFVPNVIILSGDRHEFAAATIRNKVVEFSVSPLNQFYLPIRTLSPKHGLGATGEDFLLKYIPNGNHKFVTMEVDTRTANLPIVNMKLFVDGKEAWKLQVQGKAVHASRTSIGVAYSIFSLLGLRRPSWLW